MAGEVVLSAALRNNLLSLQRTQSNIDRVQGVLSTGLKVSSALDNPQNFFASQALKNRSSDLSKLLDGIGQSIQTVKAADAGVSSLTKLVEQANSIVDSARDALASGSKEASVVGNADLRGNLDLTDLSGVTANDELDFTVISADGATTTTATVTIAANTSTDQLITAINDIEDSSGNNVLHAELTSAGYLKISAVDGGSYSVAFDAGGGGSTGSASDLSLASSLGFGTFAKVTANDAGASTAEFTATANTKLVSGVFYANNSTEFADASAVLTGVQDTASSTTAGRFNAGGSSGDTSTISITINDDSAQNITITQGVTTIQGLVDSINNNDSLNTLIEASYDATTGRFSIEAVSAEVKTLQIQTAGVAEESEADFDFGIDNLASTSATDADGETYVLASAASTLSQYEADYNDIRTQIDELVEDAGYRGINLLSGDDLNTYFNEDRTNKLTTSGSDLTSVGLGLTEADFSRSDTIEAAAGEARSALTSLRSFGGTLANSLSIIQVRETFTKSLVETLNEGSDKLTVADQNEEGAKLLALQTRQQLGVTALSLASQSQQSVLRLF